MIINSLSVITLILFCTSLTLSAVIPYLFNYILKDTVHNKYFHRRVNKVKQYTKIQRFTQFITAVSLIIFLIFNPYQPVIPEEQSKPVIAYTSVQPTVFETKYELLENRFEMVKDNYKRVYDNYLRLDSMYNRLKTRFEALEQSNGYALTALSTADMTVDRLKEDITELYPTILSDIGTFKINAYCPCAVCCGNYAYNRPTVHGSPVVITKSGEYAAEGITVAADPSVIPLGSYIYIEGYGVRRVQDIGGAVKGNKIDVYFETHETALDIEIREARVWKILSPEDTEFIEAVK